MSAAVTSFCRSTNALARGRVVGISQQGSMSRGQSRRHAKTSVAGARKPSAAHAREPARQPCSSAARRPNAPLHAPALCSACTPRPGTKQARASSQAGRPPDCECRCTRGLQPPEQSTRSQSTRRRLPSWSVGATNAAATVRVPATPTTRVTAANLDPTCGELADERLGRMRPEVHEHRHFDPRLDELQDRAIGRVVVGDGHRPVSGTHPVPADVRERRGRQASPPDGRCSRTPAGAPTRRWRAPRAAPAPSTGVRRSRIARGDSSTTVSRLWS